MGPGGRFLSISVYGGIVNQVVERAGLPDSTIAIFLSSLAFNTLVAVIIFVLFGGRELLGRRESVDQPAQEGVRERRSGRGPGRRAGYGAGDAPASDA